MSSIQSCALARWRVHSPRIWSTPRTSAGNRRPRRCGTCLQGGMAPGKPRAVVGSMAASPGI
eukprot:9347266-Lingulodinium_polyedra.AAC.1